MRSCFVTFEGGEGAGKSTQSALLAKRLDPFVGRVLETREPGGSEAAEALRHLLLEGHRDWSPLAQALIVFAARDHHLRHTIRPALDSQQWVISDRFFDSSLIYQGVAGGVSCDFLKTLVTEVVGDTQPDLTVILDLPAEIGLARAHSRNQKTRHQEADIFEAMDIGFHQKLRDGFLDLALQDPKRFAVIDATQSIEEVSNAIWETVTSRLGSF